MKKLLGMILALSLVLGLLAGCGGDKDTNQSNEGQSDQSKVAQDAIDKNNEEVRTADADNETTIEKLTQIDNAPSNLDPTAMNNSGMNFLWEIYEMPYQLTGFGGDLLPVLADATKGNYEPGMDHEDGSDEYILYIRDDIVDHAGNNITASDVVFSYELLVNSGNARGWSQYKSAEAVGDYAVKLTFQRELNLAGELTTFFARIFIVSEKAYNDSPSGLISDACGTGPYKLAEYISGSKMVLEKNEDYWWPEGEAFSWQGQAANAETIEIVYANEAASMIIALGNGEADITANLTLANAVDFQDGGQYSDDYNIYTFWDNLTYCLLPDCHEDALTGDVNMRLAIFYAANIDGMVAALAEDVPGSYRACYGMGNPNFPDFSDSWEKWENYQTQSNADLVQQYLDAAGYNGETVKIICMGGGQEETIATYLNGALDAYGIKSEITLVDRTTQTLVKSDPTNWDISVESWASSDYIVNVWDKLWKSTNDEGYISESGQFIKDDEFLEMCLNVKTADGHTQEAVDAVQQYIIDNAYAMGVAQKCSIIVYPEYVKTLFLSDKNALVPGACSFTAE